ncbi:MAG: Ig-like domain-containing protein [Clostridia bacterium]
MAIIGGAGYPTVEAAIAAANAMKGTEPITVEIFAGTFNATADNQMRITRDHVTLKGAGSEKTIINCAAFSCSGQAGLLVAANGVTVQDLKVAVTSANGNVSGIKWSAIGTDSGLPILQGGTIKNVVISAEKGNGLNIHGVAGTQGAPFLVENVKVENCGKASFALASAQHITMQNCTSAIGGWGTDVQCNYKNSPAYAVPVALTIGRGNTFANGVVCSERPRSAEGGCDVIQGLTVADGWVKAIVGKTVYLKKTDAELAGVAVALVNNDENSPYLYLDHALSMAVAGDTVNMTRGKMSTNLPAVTTTIDKDLTLVGAGKALTVIDGGHTDGTTGHQLFQIQGTANVTIKDMTLQNGYCEQIGGAVSVAEGATLTASDCAFDANVNALHYGSAVAANGTFNATNCAFTGNQSIAQGLGGAVAASGPKARLALKGCTFVGNSATGQNGVAGAVYLNDGTGAAASSVMDCTFTDNTSSANAGAIYMDNGARASIENTTFARNAGVNGGAIYTAAGAPVTITRCTFDGNTATNGNGGGGTYHSGLATIASCVYQNNATIGTSGKGGGAIVFGSAAVGSSVAYTAFVGNATTGKGTDVYCGPGAASGPDAIDLSENYWKNGAQPDVAVDSADAVNVYAVTPSASTGSRVAMRNYYKTFDAATKALGGLTDWNGVEAAYDYYIGNAGYKTIEAALSAATANDTIRILKDVEKALIVGTEGITMDGGGRYSVKGLTLNANASLQNLSVLGSVTGPGKLTIPTGTVHVTGDVQNDIAVTGGASLYVDGAATGSVTGEVYHPMTIAQPASGTIQSSAQGVSYAGKSYVQHGQAVTLTASPQAGYRFNQWTYSPDVLPSSDSWATTNPTTYTPVRGYAFGAVLDSLVTQIAIQAEKAVCTVGDTFKLAVTVTPSTAANGAITWTSAAPQVAMVDADSGVVTAKGVGTAAITATAEDGSGKTATCTVNVIPKVTFNAATCALYAGGSATLGYSVSPAGTTGIVLVSDSENVSVSGATITASAVGASTITAKYGEIPCASNQVAVSVAARTAVTQMTTTLADRALTFGDKVDFAGTLTVEPDGYTDNLAYRITAGSGITVNEKGEVAVVATSGSGRATITVTAMNGETRGVSQAFDFSYAEKQTLPTDVTFTQDVYEVSVGASTKAVSTLLAGPNANVYDAAYSDFVATTVDGAGKANVKGSGGDTQVSGVTAGVVKLTMVVKLTLKTGDKASKTYAPSAIIRIARATPTSVVIDNGTAGALMVGDALAMTATAKADSLPVSQVKQGVTWSSSAESVATVDAATGKVTAMGKGIATITATAAGTGVQDSYALTVYDRAGKLTFPGGDVVTRKVDASAAFQATIAPESTSAPKLPIAYTVSPAGILTVDGANGYKATGVGTATVIAKSAMTANGFQLIAAQKVTVVEAVTAVALTTLDNAEISEKAAAMSTKQVVQLAWTVTPATAAAAVTFESSDPSTVSVGARGQLTALKAGTATITVTAKTADGSAKVDAVKVTVTSTLAKVTLPTEITISATAPNNTTTLAPIFEPADAAIGAIAWTKTADTDRIATIDAKTGLIAGVGAGDTMVQVTAGGKTATCTVYVVADAINPPRSIEMTDAVTRKTQRAQFTSKVQAPTASFAVPIGMTAGKPFAVKLVFDSGSADWKNVQVQSADQTIATAALNGQSITITPKAIGTTDISILYKEGNVYALYRINVVNPIARISLAGTKNSLTLGEEAPLDIACVADQPSVAATDTGVSMSDVVVVDANGCVTYDANARKLTAVKAGTAAITVTAKVVTQGNPSGLAVSATHQIAVSGAPVESIDTASNLLAMVVGSHTEITPTITPSNTGATATASVSGDAASVQGSGTIKVSAVKHGSARVTFAAGGKDRTVDVVVLPESKAVELYTGAVLRWWTGASEVSSLKFTSDQDGVASVGATGQITAIKAGTAKITASCNGVTSTCDVTVSAKAVKASGISLSASTLSLSVGGAQALVATVFPADASNKNVRWSSSKETVATVDKDGKVKGIAAGTATITATTEDGALTAACAVSVGAGGSGETTTWVTGVKLNPAQVGVQRTVQLIAVYEPAGATPNALTWRSDNEKVATVTQQGLVTGVAQGEATITLTVDGGITGTAKVTVVAASAGGVTLSTDAITLVEGSTASLIATAEAPVTWSSDREGVAKVDQMGNVTAIAAGTATITAQIASGETARCRVTVVGEWPVKLVYDVLALAKGKAMVVKAPAGCTVKWTSSDPKTVTVGAKGKITGKKLGTAVITCTVTGIGKEIDPALEVGDIGQITVNVRPKGTLVTGIKPNKAKLVLAIGDTFKLAPRLKPAKAPDKQVRYASKDESIATVGKNGLVTAVSEGTTKITLLATSGKRTEVTVVVSGTAVKLTLNYKKKTIKAGETLQLIATAEPALGSGEAIIWTSANPKIATVDENGLVTALKKGKAKIVAKTASGKKVSCSIKVTKAAKPAVTEELPVE